jgi:hypothetical protein
VTLPYHAARGPQFGNSLTCEGFWPFVSTMTNGRVRNFNIILTMILDKLREGAWGDSCL